MNGLDSSRLDVLYKQLNVAIVDIRDRLFDSSEDVKLAALETVFKFTANGQPNIRAVTGIWR